MNACRATLVLQHLGRQRPGLPLLHGGEWLQDFSSSFKMLVKNLLVVTWCQQSTKKV